MLTAVNRNRPTTIPSTALNIVRIACSQPPDPGAISPARPCKNRAGFRLLGDFLCQTGTKSSGTALPLQPLCVTPDARKWTLAASGRHETGLKAMAHPSTQMLIDYWEARRVGRFAPTR